MHFTTATALVLATASSALAAPLQFTSQKFRLHAFGDGLEDWTVSNAHIGANQNAIVIQRPSATTSSKAFLSGTADAISDNEMKILFALQGYDPAHPLGMVIPSMPSGTIRQVFAQPDASAIFSIDDADQLSVLASGAEGFWACPTNVAGIGEVFTLFYGNDVKKADLPSKKCKAVTMKAAAV
ncbi:hypothetical protein LTR37_018147 [Vermiconidia calcicola]|uniref:Uncharacterized protein n=1 Tax=Vermiconidia calcicola TaxID=1690605 RepID=A0ACC3MHY0_9PEZI|nr:hypothetical protein LTR37_018147 [Vermiconidia calcicola]